MVSTVGPWTYPLHPSSPPSQPCRPPPARQAGWPYLILDVVLWPSSPAAADRKCAATLWASIPLMTWADNSLWAVHVRLEAQHERTFANATVGGSEKGPWKRLHPEDLLISRVANSFNVASKWGPRFSHWFSTSGMNLWVADRCRGFVLRRSFAMNFAFSASFSEWTLCSPY
jgi:hypothetical protein